MREDTVNIPLATMDQLPSKHSGPIGRIERLKNMTVSKYVPTEGGPERMRVDPRRAFVALSTDGRDPLDGTTETLSWDNPELFATLGNQPVSVCNSIPRVFNGEDAFIGYNKKRVVTNDLTESVFHTSDRTLQCPSNAWINGVTCEVWTETRLEEGIPFTVSYAGFKGDNGAWIRTPFVLFDPDVDVTQNVAMVRVVKDGDGERFWIVYNKNGAFRSFIAQAYDLHGELLGFTELSQNAEDPGPGYWSITEKFGEGILIAQPGAMPDGTTDVHAEIISLEWNGATIDVDSNTDATIKCRGPLAWITNDIDELNYLATVSPEAGKFVYQITDLEQTHEFNFGGLSTEPDSLIGWMRESAVEDEPTAFLGFSMLSPGDATTGPKFDPALRWSEVWGCSWVSTGGKTRQMNSVVFVSSAFLHNGEYYAYTYYQSGSGLSITETSQTVSITAGDYMIGDRAQEVTVNVGDLTRGSPKTFSGQSIGSGGVNINVTTARASVGIDGSGTPDFVELIDVAAGFGYFLPQAPSQVLAWHLKNMTGLVPNNIAGRLIIGSSSIPTADGSWDVVSIDAANKIVYTVVQNVNGGNVTPGSFTTAGTAEIDSMAIYYIAGLDSAYDVETRQFIIAQTMTISGASGANNGAKTIAAVDFINNGLKAIRIIAGSEFTAASNFTAAITSTGDNTWTFLDAWFTSVLADIPHKFEVTGSSFLLNGSLVSNDSEYLITDVLSLGIIETDGDITAQIFNLPLPKITIRVPLDVNTYTFKFQSLTLDYRYNGALVFIQGATNGVNDGLYKIEFVDVANGTFIAKPADGRTGQRSESFDDDPAASVTIFFSNNIQPVFQPKWFMTPLGNPGPSDNDMPHVGRFEDGLAYSDWRVEGDEDLAPNMFLMGVSNVVTTDDGTQVSLPYRARSFTAGQSLVSPPGQVADAAVSVFQSTVGIKAFRLRTRSGVPSVLSNELLIPGPLTSVFTQSGFREQGINVAPETPFIVQQDTISDDVHQTPNTKHQLIAVFEVTDENGDRVYCPPSPPLDYQLTGTNNSVTYGGRLPFPLDTDGVAIDSHYGLTNYRIVGICLYRTSYQGGLPTIQHFKITNDLNVNGLAPTSDLNASGFSFPDEFTWNYTDNNPDVNILTSEVLYTDKGFLPRFPANASRFSCVWMKRPWIVAYDGSLQPGGEKTEGDASWFFPGFRYTFGDDKAVACAPMGNYLIVGCERSIWYIPAGQFPDSSGRNGRFPDPVRIEKITNGCTGLMIACDGGVAYSSTSGGVWRINGNFGNEFLSSNIEDQLSLSTLAPTSLVIDKTERLHVMTGTSQMFTYDQIVKTWYNWQIPTFSGKIAATVDGELAFQDDERIFVYRPDQAMDEIEGDSIGVLWRVKFAPFSFGRPRGVKNVWEFQFIGEYHGPHRAFVEISYPNESNWATLTLRGPLFPGPDDPYLFAANPDPEDATEFQLEVYNDFQGVDPEDLTGESASIEWISAAVGVQSGQEQTTRRAT